MGPLQSAASSMPRSSASRHATPLPGEFTQTFPRPQPIGCLPVPILPQVCFLLPPDHGLYLFVHGGVRRLPDGRLLLHVSCEDQDKARRMFKSEAAITRAAHRWVRV